MATKKFGKQQANILQPIKTGPRKNKFSDDGSLAPPDPEAVKKLYQNERIKLPGTRKPFEMVIKNCDVCHEDVEVNPSHIVGKEEFWRCDACVEKAVRSLRGR